MGRQASMVDTLPIATATNWISFLAFLSLPTLTNGHYIACFNPNSLLLPLFPGSLGSVCNNAALSRFVLKLSPQLLGCNLIDHRWPLCLGSGERGTERERDRERLNLTIGPSEQRGIVCARPSGTQLL